MKNARPLHVIEAELEAAIEAEGAHEVDDCIRIGRLLLEMEAQVPHGQWALWLETWAEKWGKSVRTAQNYMAAARAVAKYARLAYLKVTREVLYDIGTSLDDLSQPFLDAFFAEAETTTARIGINRFWEILKETETEEEPEPETEEKTEETAADDDEQETGEERTAREQRERREEAKRVIAESKAAVAAKQAAAKAEADRKAEAILDGPPPKNPEPQPEAASSGRAEEMFFDQTVTKLVTCSTRPLAMFAAVIARRPDDWDKIRDYVEQIDMIERDRRHKEWKKQREQA
jgi:hypothetical protein